ncbi:aminoglycoside phosphotransferase family protein [Micromonospora viridifaciens]|uniref:aminoglycoside phosphotransferase family protein n=1 Tax=Micromonospora viridifaciens TaxID=1881 RepID=UPI000B5AE3DB|nr:aminoglycoside phosphotransferase family protein [Micromonospora viridifaciens]
MPAELPDGTPAVLKLQYPDADSGQEATALAHWAGAGAIRLLADDPSRRALLVERCVPGTPLAGFYQARGLPGVHAPHPRHGLVGALPHGVARASRSA